MAAINPRVSKPRKSRKKRWDAVLVGIGMTVAFSIVLMRLTGYFPCDIVNALQPAAAISCGDSVESNFGAFADWFRGAIRPYFP